MTSAPDPDRHEVARRSLAWLRASAQYAGMLVAERADRDRIAAALAEARSDLDAACRALGLPAPPPADVRRGRGDGDDGTCFCRRAAGDA